MLSFLVRYIGVAHGVSVKVDCFPIFPALFIESFPSSLICDFFPSKVSTVGVLTLCKHCCVALSTLHVLSHFSSQQPYEEMELPRILMCTML